MESLHSVHLHRDALSAADFPDGSGSLHGRGAVSVEMGLNFSIFSFGNVGEISWGLFYVIVKTVRTELI